jgi:hypothetical protein
MKRMWEVGTGLCPQIQLRKSSCKESAQACMFVKLQTMMHPLWSLAGDPDPSHLGTADIEF